MCQILLWIKKFLSLLRIRIGERFEPIFDYLTKSTEEEFGDEKQKNMSLGS